MNTDRTDNYRRDYEIGMREGMAIYAAELELDLIKGLIRSGIIDSYDEAFAIFDFHEENRAILLDYLPMDPERWDKYPLTEERKRELTSIAKELDWSELLAIASNS